MHAVAVTRIRGLQRAAGGYRDAPHARDEAPREELVQALAELTGRDAPDWRMRINQPLPWVVAMEPDAARAAALVVALRSRGLGAVACDMGDARAWAPRGRATLVLGERGLGFLEDARELPYDAVRAAVFATLDTETSHEEVEHITVSANPQNVRRTMPVSRYHRERSRTRALFLVRGAGEADLRLVQGSLRLQSLDSGRAPGGTTQVEIFRRACEALLERIPDAFRDERLLTARRGRSDFSTNADGVTHTTSNLRETDLVAHLIGLAWIEGQIDPASA